MCCWKMLQKQQLKLKRSDIDQISEEIIQIYQKDFSDIVHIFVKIAPVLSSKDSDLSYIHKSVYEFFIAQSVIEDTLAAKFQAVDITNTKLY